MSGMEEKRGGNPLDAGILPKGVKPAFGKHWIPPEKNISSKEKRERKKAKKQREKKEGSVAFQSGDVQVHSRIHRNISTNEMSGELRLRVRPIENPEKNSKKAWLKRWFVLRGRALYFFDDPSDTEDGAWYYIGFLPLFNVDVRNDLTISGENFTFQIVINKDGSMYDFAASSDSAASDWYEALRKAARLRTLQSRRADGASLPERPRASVDADVPERPDYSATALAAPKRYSSEARAMSAELVQYDEEEDSGHLRSHAMSPPAVAPGEEGMEGGDGGVDYSVMELVGKHHWVRIEFQAAAAEAPVERLGDEPESDDDDEGGKGNVHITAEALESGIRVDDLDGVGTLEGTMKSVSGVASSLKETVKSATGMKSPPPLQIDVEHHKGTERSDGTFSPTLSLVSPSESMWNSGGEAAFHQSVRAVERAFAHGEITEKRYRKLLKEAKKIEKSMATMRAKTVVTTTKKDRFLLHKTLREIGGKYGDVRGTRIPLTFDHRQAGHAYVYFSRSDEGVEAAEKMCEKYNGEYIDGIQCFLMTAQQHAEELDPAVAKRFSKHQDTRSRSASILSPLDRNTMIYEGRVCGYLDVFVYDPTEDEKTKKKKKKAGERNWMTYWVVLEGTTLTFYDCHRATDDHVKKKRTQFYELNLRTVTQILFVEELENAIKIEFADERAFTVKTVTRHALSGWLGEISQVSGKSSMKLRGRALGGPALRKNRVIVTRKSRVRWLNH